jgi:Asp-tRNA(Asn)/Glu-tRNA(Gln) amidotransferase B subunit
MDAWQFVGALQDLLVEARVHVGGLVEGDLPCEAVVSVRPSGTNSAGTPVRVNVPLGSWCVSDSASPRVLASRLEDQLRKEIDRQTTLLAAGKAVRHGTRTYDPKERHALSRGPRETSFNCQFYRKADVRAIGIDRANASVPCSRTCRRPSRNGRRCVLAIEPWRRLSGSAPTGYTTLRSRGKWQPISGGWSPPVPPPSLPLVGSASSWRRR